VEEFIFNLIFEHYSLNKIFFKNINDSVNFIHQENGFCSLRIYLKNKKLVPKSEFDKPGVSFFQHVTYLYQITEHRYMFCNFTSKEHYYYNEKKYTNLKLTDSIYPYVSPMIIVDDVFLENYTDKFKGRFYLPENLLQFTDDLLIDHTTSGFLESYNYTMSVGKSLRNCPNSSNTLYDYRMLQILSKKEFTIEDYNILNNFKKTVKEEFFDENRIRNMIKDLNNNT